MYRLVGLLLSTFNLDVAHARTAAGLTNRLGIIGVVFATLHIGFDELRGNQAHLVPQHTQLSRPVMGAAACFHHHQARLQLAEEIQHLLPFELLAAFHLLVTVDPMYLENLLCQIKTNSVKFHGDSSLRGLFVLTASVWRIDAVEGRSPFHWATE